VTASGERPATRSLSADEVAAEAGIPREAIDWMTATGGLIPSPPGSYRVGDVFRAKLIGALLDAGFDRETLSVALEEGSLNLQHVDEYLAFPPGPRSSRPFSEFCRDLGPRGALVPDLYQVLGLPEPNPSSPIGVDEERLVERFLDAWSGAADEALVRAARLIAEGARIATLGWSQLLDEEVAGPARERLLRGELDRFPESATQAISAAVHLAPRMFEWLSWRYLEGRSVDGIVAGFEQFLASRGVVPPPAPSDPPAVVFVDLSGYTRMTEERGDEAAARFASTLQREADAAAGWNDGRLVKLLGDGAMLRFPDARRAVAAALALVRRLSAGGELRAHAGVDAGQLIERDLDLFGRTVNVAARVADAAAPGEVLVTEDVARSAGDTSWRFEPVGERTLKGLTEPVRLFRVVAAART
jgi:adenylate cyclase